MDIKASDVKALRDATGAGMMDAKKALVEAGGDVERAKQVLREKGVVRAGKLSERTAEEGVVAALLEPGASGTIGVLVEVNCATDFVAKTERFREIAGEVAAIVASRAPADPDALAAAPAEGGTVGEVLTQASADVGEPIRVRRFARFEQAGPGVIDAYLHQPDAGMPPKVGVLVELASEAPAPVIAPLARDLALHIAAMRPTYVRRDEVPTDEVAKEREILANQAKESGKLENVIERIVEGRLRDFFAQIALEDQPFVRDDKLTVGAWLEAAGTRAGAPVSVRRFARFRVGGE